MRQLLKVVWVPFFLTACGGMPPTDTQEVPIEERAVGDRSDQVGTGPGQLDEEAYTRRLEDQAPFQGHPLDDPHSLLSQRVVYFDFDSSQLKDEYRPIIDAHANYLANHPEATIRLEGHTDERGSREYNLALGERRVNSVRQHMNLLGTSDQQMNTVSYGEERPAMSGHDESAWRLNRRVELDYLSR
jgi:peptidoglycan-associated lipoprotein